MVNYKFNCVLTPVLLSLCLSGNAQSAAAQKKIDQDVQLKSLIESRQYRFVALSATSMKGKTVQLSTGYGLILNKDSLDVDLPYYGRAYSTDYPPSSNMGIQLKSVHFSYVADTLKKGGWDITIKPKDSKVVSIYLSVSSGGYCTVRISSSDRNPISYYGTVTGNNSR